MRRTGPLPPYAANCRRRFKITFLIFMITFPIVVTSCSTVGESLKAGFTTGVTTYGKPPVEDPDVADRYLFKVYYGKLGNRFNADICATEAIEKFKFNQGYTNHAIINIENHPFPISYYLYTVEFSR